MCVRPLIFALVALGNATWGPLPATEAADVTPAPRLPVVTGKDLNGKPWTAPADFPADRTLVILGYEQEQQAAIDMWTAGMGLTRPPSTIAGAAFTGLCSEESDSTPRCTISSA